MEQNYQVNYSVDVTVSEGLKRLTEFAESVEKLSKARVDANSTISSIKTMMSEIDKVFRPNGRKQENNYKFNIDTSKSVEKLEKVKALLGEIKTMATGINMVINPGGKLKTQQVRANAKQALDEQKRQDKNITNSARRFQERQKLITRSIGKINSAIESVSKRELNIRTDKAQGRLEKILSTLKQIRTASGNIRLGMFPVGNVRGYATNHTPAPYAPQRFMPVPTPRKKNGPDPKFESVLKRYQNTYQSRLHRQATGTDRQRAAINRLQYSRPPSFRRMMPYAYMLNGYMLFSNMKREVTKAVEYSNIMQSAESILKIADNDLSTFEGRFLGMARTVRQVGVETKFTAVEVAGAVKYLAMAGQGIDTINKSIRPIANLALIGDNDLSQISDLITNIMAGYDIRPESMESVADIIASTISRSNVNIIETAESFKMSAGFMRSAGVDFTEAAAAIGILGNAGIKGTMAGTSLRAMATRFAKPPKEAQKVLDKYGVTFTRYEDVYGKSVERLKPLADIFQELNIKGATLGDMHAIFGKIGGNAAMMLLQNHEKLRELTTKNKISYGISGELAHVKQNTTKGLWYQVTSRLSETFMQGYEKMEPQIQGMLKGFLAKFSAPEFAKGLASLGSALMDIMRVLANIATWFARNFSWLEPLLFTGFVATKLFKLAGAVTNLGVALGFLGKQRVASSTMNLLSGLAGSAAIPYNLKGMSFANRRALVSTMQGMGISGKGSYAGALSRAVLPTAAGGLFATQVATGRGLVGAGASLSALGSGAVAVTGIFAALAAAVGYVGYKAWKTYEISDAALKEIEANRKYRYPSIEALCDSLGEAQRNAIAAKRAVDELTEDKKIAEVTGQKIGVGSKQWWLSSFIEGMSMAKSARTGYIYDPIYSSNDAYQDSVVEAIRRFSDLEGQTRLNAAYGKLGDASEPYQVKAFIENLPTIIGAQGVPINESLYGFYDEEKGIRHFRHGLEELTEREAMGTHVFHDYINTEILPVIKRIAIEYENILTSTTAATAFLRSSQFDYSELTGNGFEFVNNRWVQKQLGANATDEQRGAHLAGYQRTRDYLITFAANLRDKWGGSESIAYNILRAAGFHPSLFSNEPQREDPSPWNANGITYQPGDDGGAGGNYSGTGKLSSAAPKQVIVNISNLLSVDTIDLMKSPAGQTEEIQNLKEQMAQALIDVVHDFDASWNG